MKMERDQTTAATARFNARVAAATATGASAIGLRADAEISATPELKSRGAQFNKLEIDQLAMDAKRVRFPSKYPKIGPGASGNTSGSGSSSASGSSDGNAKGLTVDTSAAAVMTRGGPASGRGSSSRLTPFK